MRELTKPRRRDERGSTAIILGLSITVLLAALGLSMDIGNAAYQRNLAQDAADAAARRVAYQCLKDPTTTACSNKQAQATNLIANMMGREAVGAGISATSVGARGVRVGIAKDVETPLLGLVGTESKGISASATATWNNYPVAGTAVLPLGVSYCTWKNRSAAAGTPSESLSANRVALRTDTLQSLRNMLAPVLNLLAGFRLDSIMNALGTSATESCSDVDGRQLLTFKGALWLTGEHVVSGLFTGTWRSNGPCEIRTGNDLDAFLGGAESAVAIPTSCAARIGPGKQVAVGKTILLPIYKPRSQAGNLLGLKIGSCASFGSANRSACIEVPPKIGVEIVGYAPFKVTGWRYPGTPSGYNDASASGGCQDSSSSLNVYNIVNETFTLLERLLNSVTSLLGSLLGIGNLTLSLACNGLQGYFTKSFTRDPNFTYSPDGADFGAAAVRLTD